MKLNKTPNSTMIESNDEELSSIRSESALNSEFIFQTPKTSRKRIFKINDSGDWFLKFVRKYYMLVISILILIYSFLRPTTDPKLLLKISELREKYEKIKLELSDVKKIQSTDINIAQIEYGTTIDLQSTSAPYKYGLFKRLAAKNPIVILQNYHERGNCFAFKSTQGIITIKFPKEVHLTRFAIFYPETANKRAILKDFILVDQNGSILGNFQYQRNGYEEFEIDARCSQLSLMVKNNYGNRKYTSIYKVYCFTNE